MFISLLQAVTYLRDILNEVNADGSPPSQGGNVHPLTSHVLGFMEGLISYKDIAKIVASIYMEQESRKDTKLHEYSPE